LKVLFIDQVHPILQQRLALKGVECVDGTTLSLIQLQASLSTIHGLVIRARFTLDESLLSFAPNLQFIARSGAGLENIDVAYCERNNIRIFNAPEGNKTAVAEHALGMILSLFNNLNKADQQIRQGVWNREQNRGLELSGKTIGIIGYGNNGSAFAHLLTSFQCTIIVYDKYKTNFGTEKIKEVTLTELYQRADVISFHIPQNQETIYWANDEFFSTIKKAFYLINVSRGKIVDTRALVRALATGKVCGVALDVLEYEKTSFEQFFDQQMPEEFRYLLQSDKVILSPHVAGWTTESYFKLSDILADKIIHFIDKSG